MKRAVGIALVLVGVLGILLGLLFLLGASGVTRRYVIAAIGLGGGAMLVGIAVRLIRAGAAETPEQILAEILDLARRRNGEVTEVEIAAALGARTPLARPILDRLVAGHLCERSEREGSAVFRFKDLQPRLFVRRCEYCGAEMSIARELARCPRCGGTLRLQTETVASRGGDYRMDE